MIINRIDILEELKKKGFSTYALTKDPGYFSAQTIQNIRKGAVPGIKTLDIICKLLNCQPGHVIKYVPDKEPDNKTE